MISVINTHFEVGASIVISKYSLIEKEFWKTLKNSKVTSFNGVPYTYEILTKIGLKNIKIKTLKYLTHAGGKLEKDKLKEIIKSHNHLINEHEIQYGFAFDQYFDQNYSKSIEICKKLIKKILL